jgi:AraC family transcriptional regulator
VIVTAEPLLIAELNAPAFGLEEVVMPAHMRMAGHAHAQPHLCLVLGGAFAESGTTMTSGMLRLSPAGDTHDIEFLSAGARCFLLTFNATLSVDAPLPDTRRFLDATSVLPFVARLREADGRTVAGDELLVLEILARAALPEHSARRGAPPAWLTRIRTTLDDQPFDPPSTETLAAEAGRHPVYVARAFRAWYGCSLASYARLLRLDRAIRMTLETAEPMSRIAARAGFADQSHLHRAIRERTGMTPRALRRAKVSRVQDFRSSLP